MREYCCNFKCVAKGYCMDDCSEIQCEFDCDCEFCQNYEKCQEEGDTNE